MACLGLASVDEHTRELVSYLAIDGSDAALTGVDALFEFLLDIDCFHCTFFGEWIHVKCQGELTQVVQLDALVRLQIEV